MHCFPYCNTSSLLCHPFTPTTYNLLGSFLYHEDYKLLDDDERSLYKQSVSAFGSTAPYYHISLLDNPVRPVLVWDFYSLVSALQMVASLMLVDEEHPARLCQNCMKVFIADNPDQWFCCPMCADGYASHGGKNNRKKK